MFNIFVIKKTMAYILSSMLPLMFFVVGLMITRGNIYASLAITFLPIALFWLVFGKLLKNPLTDVVEGKGMAALTLDSTGIIQPFNVSLYQGKYIKGGLHEKEVKDVFDRESVSTLKPSKKGLYKQFSDGSLLLYLPAKDADAAKFGMMSYVTFIWNKQLESFVTKDVLGDTEHKIFAEHNIRFLNALAEDTHLQIRNFARHAIDQGLRPIKNILKSEIFVYFIVGVLLVVGLIFAPQIIQFLGSIFGTFQNAIPAMP